MTWAKPSPSGQRNHSEGAGAAIEPARANRWDHHQGKTLASSAQSASGDPALQQSAQALRGGFEHWKPFKRLLWRTLAALQTRQQQGSSVHHQVDPVRFVDPQRAFHAAANVALAEVQQTRDGGVRLHGLHQAHADDGKAGRCKERNGGVSRVPSFLPILVK